MLGFSLLNQLQGLGQSGEGEFILQVYLALPMEAGKVSAPLKLCWLLGFCPSSQASMGYAGLALAALCWHRLELNSKQSWQCLSGCRDGARAGR